MLALATMQARPTPNIGWVDYLIIGIYFVATIGIGFVLRTRMRTSEDFFLSGRSLPSWVTGLAFVGANLGALEILGMGANAAQYGILQAHFYWIGAIPAMIFVAIFMMPFYYGSRTHSVPGFLKLRYNEATRGFNALTFAILTLLTSGINMYAAALVFNVLLGWSLNACIWLAALFIMAYILLGGLTSSIYNETLQFFLIVAGLLPLTIVGLINVGGWSGLQAKVNNPAFFHLWAGTAGNNNPFGVNFIGIILGLGFVLSFGYWCTDFLVVQRALASEDMAAAQRTPLIATFPKLFFPFLAIIPGLIILSVLPNLGHGGGFQNSYNMAIPFAMVHYFPSGLLGLGLTALLASFMSGMAGNVTAFNTVWTYDIYRSYIKRDAEDRHYLRMGRIVTVVGIVLSVGTAYLASSFNSIM
ncbi:MAG TPA: sodium/solute symporter, partial [Ktedonobacteraceae bacterium]